MKGRGVKYGKRNGFEENYRQFGEIRCFGYDNKIPIRNAESPRTVSTKSANSVQLIKKAPWIRSTGAFYVFLLFIIRTEHIRSVMEFHAEN